MTGPGSHPLLSAIAHFALFAGEALVVGLLPVVLLVLRPALASCLPRQPPAGRSLSRQPPAGRTTAVRVAWLLDVALGFAVVATLALIALQVAVVQAVRGGLPALSATRSVLDTPFGLWSLLRLGVLASLAVVLHGRVRGAVLADPVFPDPGPAGPVVAGPPALWWWSWGVLGVFLLLTVSLTGHAASGRLEALSVTADVLHLAAGAAWLTGVSVLAVVLPRQSDGKRDQDGLLSAVVVAFSRLALVAIPVVAVTGTISGLADVGRLRDLRVTGYGHALVLKVWLFGWVLAFGAYNHFRLRRRLTGQAGTGVAVRARETLALTVTGELVFGLLVIAATALLVGLPKPG